MDSLFLSISIIRFIDFYQNSLKILFLTKSIAYFLNSYKIHKSANSLTKYLWTVVFSSKKMEYKFIFSH